MNSVDELIHYVEMGELVLEDAKGQVKTQLAASVAILKVITLANDYNNIIQALSDHEKHKELSESEAIVIWQFARTGMAVAMGSAATSVLNADRARLKSKVQEQ